VEEFVSEKVFDIVGLSKEVVKSWIDSLNKENNSDNLSFSPSLFVANQEVTFEFEDLPQDFYELSTTYIEKNCELCNDHPQAGSRCICLLCKMLLCSTKCTKKNKHGAGNLNRHSIECHGGACAFLNVEQGSVYLINSPKNIEY